MDRIERNRQIAAENDIILASGEYEMGESAHFLTLCPEARRRAAALTPRRLARLQREQSAKLTDRLPAIEIVQGDSMDHAQSLVLNFANAVHPGGGYLSGSNAQEECLCRESTLYESLTSCAASEMYEYNRACDDPMDSDYLLLSPFVEIFRHSVERDYALRETSLMTAVITAAAPDLRGRASGHSQSAVDETMIRRIENILAVSSAYGYRTLTLGAWGCGAFGHDAARVSGYFHDVLILRRWASLFDRIVFAIYDPPEGRQYNLRAFQKQFLPCGTID